MTMIAPTPDLPLPRAAMEHAGTPARDTLGRFSPPESAFSLAVAETVRDLVWSAGLGPIDLPELTGLTLAEVNARWNDGRWEAITVWLLAEHLGVDSDNLFASFPWVTR